MRFILYEQMVGFPDFGIQIPVRNDRVSRTLEELAKNPEADARLRAHLDHEVREKITREDLLRVHDAAYVERLYSPALEEAMKEAYELVDGEGNYRRFDPSAARYPLSGLFDQALLRSAGTLQCARAALEEGFAFFFSGGMHHAHAGFGHGFCPINDTVIAIRRLQAEGRIRSAWIIDSDAHKGDGTAAITAGDDSIRTFSIHMASGWPLDGPEYDDAGHRHPSFIPSDVDVPVKTGEEGSYIEKLHAGLTQLDRFTTPDLAVVLFGADPYEHDMLESAQPLKLPLETLAERDETIYRFLTERSLPAAYLMAGGYGPRAWEAYHGFLERILTDRLTR
jgi:acetoin utilization deacetylase AcuC-like enzyme